MKIEHENGRIFAIGYCKAYYLLSYSNATKFGSKSGIYGWNYDLYEFPQSDNFEISTGNRPIGEDFPFCKALDKAESLIRICASKLDTKKRKALEFWDLARMYIRKLDNAIEKAKEETPHRWKVETKKKRDELETAFLADIEEWKKEL